MSEILYATPSYSLQGLVDAGLADPARVRAALAYRGVTSPLRQPEACPRSILERWVAGAFTETPYLLRRISHLKVVVPPDRAPFAKIYLEAVSFWTGAGA